MIKQKIFTKLGISFALLFTLSIIYLIPKNNFKQELEYVNVNTNKSIVYLLNDNNLLSRTYIETINTEPIKLIDEILKKLINQDELPNGFKSLFNSNTNVLNIDLENKLLKLEFDYNLLEINRENELKLIESIVYTLTSIKDIDNIIIYIDGEVLTKLPKSNYNLPSTLNRKIGINKSVDITYYEDIKQVTTYFIGKNKDYYYIPVTKYLNDKREKITIIIDELVSNNSYNTNLMSFLNSNLKLIDVGIEEETMYLTFNEYIFSDFNTNEILEEVINTISLSVKENYEVKDLVFKCNDKEIYKKSLKTIE